MFRFLIGFGVLLFFLGGAAYAFAPPLIALGVTAGTSTFTSLAPMITLAVGTAITALYLNFFPDSTRTNPVRVDVQTYPNQPGFEKPKGLVYSTTTANPYGTADSFVAVFQNSSPNCYGPDPNFYRVGGNTYSEKYSDAVKRVNSTQALSCTNTGRPPTTMYHSYKIVAFTNGTLDNTKSIYSTGSGAVLDGKDPVSDPAINNALKVRIANNLFELDTADADYQRLAADQVAPVVTSTGQLVVQYPTDTGTATAVITNTTTGTTIEEYQQTNTTTVQKTTASVSSTGTVSAMAQTQVQGTLATVPATTTGTITTYTPVTAPTTNTGTQTQTQTFPTDYARQGEAMAAATQLGNTLLQGELTAPTVPDTPMPWFGDTFDGPLGLSLNTSGAVCPVWEFQALGDQFLFDQHCQLITEFNSLFYAIFTAMWVLVGFRTVMEA